MDINIVDILNTGVTGFAFLMLFLGYRLTAAVQTKILEQKTDEFSSVEMYREWKSLVCAQLNNTRFFIAFSLIFFAGGLALLMYQHNAESKIILSVTPLDSSFIPRVVHQTEELQLNESGRIILNVQNEHNISVSNEQLVRKLQELIFSLEDQKRIYDETLIKKSSTSDELGF